MTALAHLRRIGAPVASAIRTGARCIRRVSAPVVSAAVTAAVIGGGLWIQHARGAWPFESPASPVAAMQGTVAAGTAGSDRSHGRVPVDVTADTVQALGIRLETVGRESLTQDVRAVVTVVPDESRISHVHTRVSGWVEQLDVNTTGEMVRAGQPLLHIFSQELLASQTEYLAARRTTSASGISSVVVAGGRTRLGVLGMSPAEIDAIEQTGEPTRLVTVYAPRSGVVVNRGVTVGTSVDPSTTLVTIADLSRVWVLAEVPEASITAVRPGSMARLDFPASGRPPFAARVDFIYPTLTERTRTLRVRLSAANAGGALKPGLYGTADFATTGQDVLTVPRDAVVDTGLQQHVFVATGNRFEPRPVTLGVQLADRVEIRSGLQGGERIAAAGVFLLDSESRLRATGGTAGHQHGAPTTADEAPTPPVAEPAVEADGPGTPPPRVSGPHAGHRE
jgi:membrane fusion protein, copper/silver efflux system